MLKKTFMQKAILVSVREIDSWGPTNLSEIWRKLVKNFGKIKKWRIGRDLLLIVI